MSNETYTRSSRSEKVHVEGSGVVNVHIEVNFIPGHSSPADALRALDTAYQAIRAQIVRGQLR